MIKKMADMKRRRNLFVKINCASLTILETSYKIVFVLAEKHRPFSGGEDIVEPCLH